MMNNKRKNSNLSPTDTEEQHAVYCRRGGLSGCLQPFSLYQKDSNFDDAHKGALRVKSLLIN